jgi:DNA polymerase III subunit epsilon
MSAAPILQDQPLVFVDIETNGLNHIRGRIIEVAAIRVENGKIVQEFSSLVDPEIELPQFITNLTGITGNDLRIAPTFAQIADELQSILQDAVFVAHNVRFDYSFLKQEFKRLERVFLPKQLCTVKLSRALYPHERSHKLQSLIERHGFSYSQRHRAYDDAAVLWQFVQHIQQNFTVEQLSAAVSKQLRSPAVPRALQPELVRDLPDSPGVYIFEDASGRALYVGKSVNIKKRVMSHFGRDHAESREFKISQAIKNIRTQQTPGELSALLLESRLVKELQPIFNRQLRRLNQLLTAQRSPNEHGYDRLLLREVTAIDPDTADQILAVYPRRARAKESLNTIAKQFDLCPKLMGLEKSAGACFLYQLGKCRGACVGRESPIEYNQRLMTAFDNQRIISWPYRGPIMVEETWNSESMQAFIIDKWCVLGELRQEPYCEPVAIPRSANFDLDTYKILRSQLAQNIQRLVVKPLDKVALKELGF